MNGLALGNSPRLRVFWRGAGRYLAVRLGLFRSRCTAGLPVERAIKVILEFEADKVSDQDSARDKVRDRCLGIREIT
jgi:hypothetical protein